MSPIDMHPEDLLDEQKRGELSESDQRRIEAHLAQCAACRFERDVAADLSSNVPTDDEALLARLVSHAVASSRAAGETPAPGTPAVGLGRRRRRRKGRIHRAAAAIVLVAATATAAALWLSDNPVGPPGAPRPEPAHSSGSSTADRSASGSSAPVAAEVAGEETASDPARSGGATPVPSAAPPLASAIPATREKSAADLFSEANQARRSGSAAEAARIYRELQQRHPSSREAFASRLALARLMLDRLGDPAGALKLFDQYLAAGGTLSEEALLGRALALGRLGREAEERAAWALLIARYPKSVHARRARERLDQPR